MSACHCFLCLDNSPLNGFAIFCFSVDQLMENPDQASNPCPLLAGRFSPGKSPTYDFKILSGSTTWGESLAVGSPCAQSCPCAGPWITPKIVFSGWQESGCLGPDFGLLWGSSMSLTYLASSWGGWLQFINNRSHLQEAGQRLSLAGEPTVFTPAIRQTPGRLAAQQPRRALGFSSQRLCGRCSQTR